MTAVTVAPRTDQDRGIAGIDKQGASDDPALGAFEAITMTGRTGLLGVALIGLVSCGGGGSGGGGAGAIVPPPAGWVSGVFSPATNFAARCAAPRSGIDPDTGRPYPDRLGTTLTEKNWLRSWSNDLYLWYSEIVDLDPAPYTVPDYFDLLKTRATTPSGNPKDKFHFTYATSAWQELSQSGVSAGYGATWVLVAQSPPRKVLVAYTEADSPATAPLASLVRGAEVTVVDGVDVVNGDDVDALNAAFFPAAVNETHTFTVRDPGGATRTFSMTSENVTSVPVQNVKRFLMPSNDYVGYILFNDHIATAEKALIDAVNALNNSGGVKDLVLDVRYNGGGYLVIASELAYMIAGATRAAGKTFETLHFNNKHPTTDPVTGQPLTPVLFQTKAVGLSAPSGQPLPTLILPRVFVLTGPNTCSASESIVNSLEGIGVEVIQIGSTTCGKPYGFYPTDNCGTTYFTVQFQGKNAVGFGDYTDGFSPANTVNIPGVPTTGCSIADDFTRELGDPLEGRLAVALSLQQGNACPSPTGFAPGPGIAALTLPTPADGVVRKPEWLQNKIMRR
jgi:carboxyl-terminal processing protease